MNSIKLEKGIVHLMLPFRIGTGWSSDIGNVENEIWTRTDEDIQKFDFLLEHVREFFTKNMQSGKEDDSACQILKLKKEALPSKMFNNKTYWLTNKSFDNIEKAKNPTKLSVSFDPFNFRLIVHPYTGIAILTYSVELVKSVENNAKPSLTDFIQMNYLLRLFNRHDEAFLISQNDRPEERGRAAQLLTNRYPGLFNDVDTGNIEQTGWRPKQLINYVLHRLNTDYKVEFFDHYHFSPICYVQTSEEILNEEQIHQALFFLRKVYDFDYTPAEGVLQRESELFHPYKQIYYASSLEGAVIFNNCSSSDPEFIRTFYSGSFQKSLWLNILGVLQRSIFLKLMKEVSDIDSDDHQKIKNYLKRYSNISLKALFSKVSVYHQHNDYYDLLLHNLQINELQKELEDELTGLNNLQRQFHEDEVEKHEEVEKQYNNKLNMILFALSIFGLTQVTYAALGNRSLSVFQHILAIGIPLLLGFTFWKMLSIRKK